MIYENKHLSFATYDDEHRRVAFLDYPRNGEYFSLQLAESHLTRSPFRQIVARNEEGLAWEPRVRGKGAHEQAIMFLTDPSGSTFEFKGLKIPRPRSCWRADSEA